MFTQAEKDELTEMLGAAFEAFQERIVIYKTSLKTFVATEESDFNFAYGDEQPAVEMQYTPQSGEFWATVEYVNLKDAQQLLYFSTQSNIKIPKGDVKISVSGSEAADFLRNVEHINLDGQEFKVSSDIVPRGLFNRDYYDCWLEKIGKPVTNG